MGTPEDAERVVQAMCDTFAKHDAEALRPFFTDDVVYHNVPTDSGRDHGDAPAAS
jgi:hypothetical protein